MLFVVMESELSTMSIMNILLKYADDTSLLVPSDSDTDLVDEFDNIKRWAAQNHMVINLQKPKNLSFDDPIPGLLFFHCHLIRYSSSLC